MHADTPPIAPADHPREAPATPSLATLPQQVVLHAGARLVVVDQWRLATAALLRDGAVQRVGQARDAGDDRPVVRFDDVASDLAELTERRAPAAPRRGVVHRELRTREEPAPTSLWPRLLTTHPHAALTAAVLRRLQRAPGASHQLGALGAAHGVSPYHVAHVFREQTGLSVHRYLLRLRLAIALDLLAGGAANLSALALDLGFSSHSHFSSVFRRSTGLSPTGVRAAFLARPERRARRESPLRATLAS